MSSYCFCLVLLWKRRTPMWADVDTSESPLTIIYLSSFSIQAPEQRKTMLYRDHQLIRYRRFIFPNGHPQHQQQQQQQQYRMACRKKALPATQVIHPQQRSELEQDNQAFQVIKPTFEIDTGCFIVKRIASFTHISTAKSCMSKQQTANPTCLATLFTSLTFLSISSANMY